MKKLSGVLLLFLLVFVSSCDTETPEKAKTYYSSIIDKINILTKDYETPLINSFDKFVPEDMSSKLTALEAYVKLLEEDFSKMDSFYGDETLLKGGKEVVQAYKETLPLYAAIVKNESIPQKDYNEDNSNVYKDSMKKINDKLNPVMDKNKVTANAFGAAHNVIIKPETTIDPI